MKDILLAFVLGLIAKCNTEPPPQPGTPSCEALGCEPYPSTNPPYCTDWNGPDDPGGCTCSGEPCTL